jgi:phosphatidate cytidylyltransferase
VGELRKRVFAGLCLAPLVALLFYILPLPWFFLFLVLIEIVAVSELVAMAKVSKKYLSLALIIFSLVPLYYKAYQVYLVWLLLAPAVYLVFELVAGRDRSEGINEEILKGIIVVLVGEIFIALPFFYVYLLKELNVYLPLILLFSVWASDTFAYFFGKTFGKTPLVPRISPKKTREGLLGAIFGSLLILSLTSSLSGMGTAKSLIVGAAIGLLGQIGDIFESIGKRVTGIKDSSALIPGHGGLLDRMDSFIFTAPFLYSCMVWQV